MVKDGLLNERQVPVPDRAAGDAAIAVEYASMGKKAQKSIVDCLREARATRRTCIVIKTRCLPMGKGTDFVSATVVKITSQVRLHATVFLAD